MPNPLLNRYCVPALLAFSALWASAVEIRTPTYHSPPKYSLVNGAPKGLCIEVIREIEKLEPGIRFVGTEKQLTLAAIEAGVLEGTYDLMLCNAKTEDRAKKMNVVDIPVYMVDDVLVVRMDDAPMTVKSLEDIPKLPVDSVVLAWDGTTHAKYVAKIPKLKVDARAKTIGEAFAKLENKQGRFLFTNQETALQYMKENNLRQKYKIWPAIIRTEGRFFIFSKKVPDDVVAKVKNALEKMSQSGQLKAISDRYSQEFNN